MAGAKGRSGGYRSGAGRKPLAAELVDLHGYRDRATSRPSAELESVPMDRPEGLSPEVVAVWDDLAEHARQAGTLVPGTVPAFLRLCRAVVTHAQMETQIGRDGYTYLKVTIDGAGQEHTEVKAHPLISRAESIDNKVRGWMKDFAINPFGKPLVSRKAKPANPFAKFGATG